MEEEVLGKAYDGRLMRRLLTYMRPYWRTVAVSLVFLLANSLLQTLGPLLTKLAVDRYLAPVSSKFATPIDHFLSANPATGLAQIAFLYLFVLVGAMVCDFAESYLMQWTGQKAMFDLRRQIMGHLQTLDIAFYDRNPVGRLLTRVTTDVDTLNDLFSSGLITILGDLMSLGFIVAVMFRLSPGLTGLLLAVMPAVVVVTMIFRRSVQQSYRRIRVAIARINAYLQEHINGMSVLQLFNREARGREEFARINRDHMEAYKDAITAYGWFYPVVEFLSMLALALLFVYGGFRIGGGALTLGILIAFFQYGLRFFRPIQDLSEKYNILQGAMAASERIFKLLDTPAKIESAANAAKLPAIRRETGPSAQPAIEFDGVWFAYKDEDWVLRDVSFRIECGETIAVVGHTGAGKTTIISLLLRFYDVQRGAIRIHGEDTRKLELKDLRRRFGVVLQDPYLFTGTVAGNIRLGTEGIGDETIAEAARRVNLLDYIETLPERFEHPVRERGSGFSTGQKQLISFARALAHDPDILILDEATSSVDTETEMKVREALDRLVAGRTSIIIAHRLSTIQRASRILVMHKGQLREFGTHQELLARRGIYWKLYQLQYKDQDSGGQTAAESAPEAVAGD